MKLPGCLPPLGVLLAVSTLLVVAGIIYAKGNQIFSPGPLNAVSDSSMARDVSSHAELDADCAACHTPPWGDQRMADRCVACHTETQTQLLDPATLHGALDARNCRDCHTEHQGAEASLTQVESLVVDHEQFRFSLAVHQTTAEQLPFGCADCHSESLTRFDPTACETCHREDQPDFIALHAKRDRQPRQAPTVHPLPAEGAGGATFSGCCLNRLDPTSFIFSWRACVPP